MFPTLILIMLSLSPLIQYFILVNVFDTYVGGINVVCILIMVMYILNIITTKRRRGTIAEKMFIFFSLYTIIHGVLFYPNLRMVTYWAITCAPFALYFLLIKLISHKKSKNLLFAIHCALLFSILPMLPEITSPGAYLTGVKRLTGVFVFGEITMLTSYLYATFALFYWILFERISKLWYFVIFIFTAVLCLFGGTRGHIYPLFIVCSILYITYYRTGPKKGKPRRMHLIMRNIFLLFMVFTLILFLLRGTYLGERLLSGVEVVIGENMFGKTYQYIEPEYLDPGRGTFGSRVYLWRYALSTLTPILYVFGRGLGSSIDTVTEAIGVRSYMHNDFIGLIHDIGIIGLIVYFATLILLVKQSFSPYRDGLRLLVGYILFEVITFSTANAIFPALPRLMLFAGLAAIYKMAYRSDLLDSFKNPLVTLSSKVGVKNQHS